MILLFETVFFYSLTLALTKKSEPDYVPDLITSAGRLISEKTPNFLKIEEGFTVIYIFLHQKLKQGSMRGWIILLDLVKEFKVGCISFWLAFTGKILEF